MRLAIAGAIAALLVCALCIPGVFGDDGLLFAAAYGVVRIGQIVLFVHASRDDAALRASVLRLGASTVVGTGLLVAASAADGELQVAIWGLAVVVDFAGAILADPAGWQLRPHHFAERHGLIVIIALGESIVAVGAGASGEALTTGVVAAAVLGALLSFALWWLYFDVIALVATRRLAETEPGLAQNTLARDSFSYLHLLLVAGIVLVALGLKKTIGHIHEPLDIVPSFALLGGFALYLCGHLLIRWRNVRVIDREQYPTATALNRERLAFAVVLLAAIPFAGAVDALWLLAIVTAAAFALIAIEVRRQGDFRRRLRSAPPHA
ncbi:MAG: low temperature requirement protein A [Baekduia sp.]